MHTLYRFRSWLRRRSNAVGVWLDTRGMYRTADVVETALRAVWSRIPKSDSK